MDVLTPGRKSSKKATDGAGCSMMMMVRAAEGREGIITGIMGKGSYAMYVCDEEGELDVTDLASDRGLYSGRRVMVEKGMGCFHLKDPCFGIVKEGEIPRMSCMPDIGIIPRIKGRNWIVLICTFDPLSESIDGASIQTLVKEAFSGAQEIESVVREILGGITGSATVMVVDTGDAQAHPAFTKELFASCVAVGLVSDVCGLVSPRGPRMELGFTRVGYVFDSAMEMHRGGLGHPEHPSRVRSIHERLADDGLLERMKIVEGRSATGEELQLVHPEVHVDRVMQFGDEGALKSAMERGEDSEGPYNPSSEDESEENYVVVAHRTKDYIFPFGADTYVCEDTPKAATLSTGCVLALLEEIMDPSSAVDRGFACVRPPGHHATTSEAMGFCLFNNVAVGAQFLRQRYGLNRIAIVDWDVHHGNGTCDIFAQDPNVLVVSDLKPPGCQPRWNPVQPEAEPSAAEVAAAAPSTLLKASTGIPVQLRSSTPSSPNIHRFDGGAFYPGTGNWTEMGSDDGLGYTLNVPIDGTYGDDELQFAFSKLVIPALASFRPDFILVSCGFDACVNDPLGECYVTPECYGSLTRQLLGSFGEGVPARVALVLEGGYNLDSIAASAQECVGDAFGGCLCFVNSLAGGGTVVVLRSFLRRALLADSGLMGGEEEPSSVETLVTGSPTRQRSVPLGEPKTSLIRTLHNLTSCLTALPTNMSIPVVSLPRRGAQRQSPSRRNMPNKPRRSSSFKDGGSQSTPDMAATTPEQGSDSDPQSSFEEVVVSGGGHTGGVMRDPENDAFIIKKTKLKEAQFYSLLFSLNTDPPLELPSLTENQKNLLEKLKPLIPVCTKVERAMGEKEGAYRIWLEDLTRGMKEPCVMDVKLGDKYWENGYTGAKLQEKLDKVRDSSAGELAVRLTALCTNGAATGPSGGAWSLSKKECAELGTPSEIITVLRRYIWMDRESLGGEASAITKKILEWFEVSNGSFEVVCSSILLAFDAAEEKPEMRGKLIDFAHVDYSGTIGDAGAVKGLRNLVDYWECARQD
ncbi:hypothetical protein FOL47_005732 [Perkinsus chesapeaki]|uniref:histone deacetylase n=1 Tax=Perkinsus chesapeaki TaxID=330153 RepID=A0A7J6LW22_PERCH|nr:hypothetical protein FOL47_005732 [Perkinsus chesapeaki]